MARMADRRGEHCLSVGRPEVKRPLANPRRKWEDNIKIDLKNWFGEAWAEWIWLRIGTSAGCL